MRCFLLLLAVGFSTCAAQASLFESKDIGDLKRDLTKAQKELSAVQLRVQRLEEAIAYHEIKRIEKEIERVEAIDATALLHSREQRLAFFSDQRKTLSDIIHHYPGCAPEAQAVLDQILTLITSVCDEIID